MNPFLIGIAGDSGVGKTTIANIISSFYGKEKVLQLSTDDLHLWPRAHKNWDTITHLNPKANNLDLGDEQIKNLLNNNSIWRTIYNHNTGFFDAPVFLSPKEIIINEGLHSFYTDYCKEKTNLKIFVDVEENLRTHWKILRDVKHRSSTIQKVLNSIEKRKKDSLEVKQKQLSSSDVIIRIESEKPIINVCDFDTNPSIKVFFKFINNKFKNFPVFLFIDEYFKSLNEYIRISKKIGKNKDLTSKNGGNFSIKLFEEFLLIKSSGTDMSDANYEVGHNIVNNNLNNLYKATNDDILDKLINLSNLYGLKSPSMETAIHCALNGKYTLHTHPKHLNVLLCIEESEKVLKTILDNINFTIIEYKTPGFELFKEIMKTEGKIIFLKNHGLVVSTENIEETVELTEKIDTLCKQFILKKVNFSNFEFYKEKKYFFPDSFILSDLNEIVEINNFIGFCSQQLGTPVFLSTESIDKLNALEAEKRRKK